MSKEFMPRKLIINRLDSALDYYHRDVIKLNDVDLWEHCFTDDDVKESDFCIQELKKRFLNQQQNG